MSRRPNKPETEPPPNLQGADAAENSIYHVMISNPDVKERRKARKLLRRLGFHSEIEKIDIVPQRPAFKKERVKKVYTEAMKARFKDFLEKKQAEQSGAEQGAADLEDRAQHRRRGPDRPRLNPVSPDSQNHYQDHYQDHSPNHPTFPLPSQTPQTYWQPPIGASHQGVLTTPTPAAKLPPLPPGQRYVFRFLSNLITTEGRARAGMPVNVRAGEGGRTFDDLGREIVVVDVPFRPEQKVGEPPYQLDEDTGTWTRPNVPVKVEPHVPQPQYRPISPVPLSPLLKPAKPPGACVDQPRNGKCPPGCPTCTGWCSR